MANRKQKGDGSIYFSEAAQRWIGEIRWTDNNGKKCRKVFKGTKQTTVKNKLNEFKRQLIVSPEQAAGNDKSFQEFADWWLNSILVHSLKPTSYDRKEGILVNQVYPLIGHIPINKLSYDDIQGMINDLTKQEYSYSTIKKAYEAVSGCLKVYRTKTKFPYNPCEGITLPTKKAKDIADITWFNKEQRQLIKQEAIRTYSNGKPVYRLGYAIIVLMYTGMRVSELLALQWNDIDFNNNTISIDKNAVVIKIRDGNKTAYKLINQDSAKTKNGTRMILMTKEARNALLEMQRINGDKKYVMASSTGKQLTPRNINRLFHSILTQTGLIEQTGLCGVHSLRHTFASMLFENNCDIKTISEILGHSDTKVTENIYVHLINQRKINAIKSIDQFSD